MILNYIIVMFSDPKMSLLNQSFASYKHRNDDRIDIKTDRVMNVNHMFLTVTNMLPLFPCDYEIQTAYIILCNDRVSDI